MRIFRWTSNGWPDGGESEAGVRLVKRGLFIAATVPAVVFLLPLIVLSVASEEFCDWAVGRLDRLDRWSQS